MDELWQMALAALVGAGGLLGGQGLLARVVAARTEGQQTRQTTMAAAVVEMSQNLSAAMIELAREGLRTAATNVAQLAMAFEADRKERALQFTFLRDCLEGSDAKLDEVEQQVETIGENLTTLVRLMSENGGREDGK